MRHVAGHTGLVRRALGFPTGVARPAPRRRHRDERNPLLGLPCAHFLAVLHPRDRTALASDLAALHADAARFADEAWRRNPDTAAYWRDASVYAGHLGRAVRRATKYEQGDLLAA